MIEVDLLAQLAALPTATGYTKQDRYRDFKTVFSTEEGKRVLREVLGWGHLLQPAAYGKPIDPYLTHVREGEANIARRLLVTVSIEPVEPPKTQTRTR